jgi:hypothetical protein
MHTHTRKYTCWYYDCLRSERQSSSDSSTPQLKSVRVIPTCVRARVCAGHIELISLLWLFVCRRDKKKTHTQATLKTQTNTCRLMIENQHFHSSTVRGTQPRETRILTQEMKARQKRRVAGSTTDCCSNQSSCIEEKQRLRQPAVRYTQKKNIYLHTNTHKYACLYV